MSERTPLLESESAPLTREPVDSPRKDSRESSVLEHLGTFSVCIILLVLIEFGAYLATIPLNQVLEENICQRLHLGVALAPNDPACKDKSVQSELSLIRGWQSTFDFIPGLLVAVPYGILADKVGRGFVLTLSSLGITLSFGFYVFVCAFPSTLPPRLTWLSAIFTFIGGGAPVMNAMIFTIAGDIASEESRATTFFYLGAAVLGGELLSGPALYFLMEVNIWLPIWLGLGCFGLSTILARFLPETLPKPAAVSDSSSEETPILTPATDNKIARLLYVARSEISKLARAVSWLAKRHYHVMTLLFTLLLTTFGRFAQELLSQYVTKRYNWSWSQSSFLLSIRAFFNLILLGAGLPFASYLLVHKWSFSGRAKDLWLARASGLLLTVGAFTIGLASEPVLMSIGLGLLSLGSGYTLLVRSLLASLVEKNQIGTMYSGISVVETIGVLVAGPLLAISFRVGMEKDGGWLGLPYIVAGFLFTLATCLVSAIRASSLEHPHTDMSPQEQEQSA